jgi:hypothetical protein
MPDFTRFRCLGCIDAGLVSTVAPHGLGTSRSPLRPPSKPPSPFLSAFHGHPLRPFHGSPQRCWTLETDVMDIASKAAPQSACLRPPPPASPPPPCPSANAPQRALPSPRPLYRPRESSRSGLAYGERCEGAARGGPNGPSPRPGLPGPSGGRCGCLPVERKSPMAC